jgi:hypothetical protein
VARAGDGSGGHRVVRRGELLGCQRDVRGGGALRGVPRALRAGNRHRVVAVVKQPARRALARRCAAGLVGDRPHALDEGQVRLQVVAVKARPEAAKIVLGEVIERNVPAGEEATADRAEATIPTPSSPAAGTISASTPRVNSDHAPRCGDGARRRRAGCRR